jgi:hypothetical protein
MWPGEKHPVKNAAAAARKRHHARTPRASARLRGYGVAGLRDCAAARRGSGGGKSSVSARRVLRNH